MVHSAFRRLLIVLLALTAATALLVPVGSAQGGSALIEVAPEGSPVPVEPGHTAGVRIDLANPGATAVHHVRLDFVSADGWSASFDLQDFTLEAGQTRTVRLLVDVPAEASAGDHAGEVRVTAGLQGEPAGAGELVLRVSAPEAAEAEEPFRVLAAEAEANATRGSVLDLTFSLVNPGNTTLTLDPAFRIPSYFTWLTAPPERVDVPPGSTHALTVSLRVQDDAPAGDAFVTLSAYRPPDEAHAKVVVHVAAPVEPSGSSDPADGGDTSTSGDTSDSGSGDSSTPAIAQEGVKATFELALDPSEVELSNGAEMTGTLLVRNTGEIPITVRLAADAPSSVWEVAIENADGVYVPAGGETSVAYSVRSPEAVPAGEAVLTFRGVAEDVERTASLRVLTTPYADAPAGDAEEALPEAENAESPLDVATAAWGALYAQHGALAVAGAAAVATGGAGGVYFLGTESGRRKLWWIGAGLYTRLTKPTLLDHPERERLYGMIQENPGLHFHGLKRELGWNTGTLTYHLRVLERHRMITSRKDQLMRRFYAQGDQPNHVPRRTQVGGLRGEVLEVVRERGEVQQADLTDILGQTKQTINYHVKNLERMGLIEVEKVGRNTVLRPLDEEDEDDGPGAVSGPVPPFKEQLRKSGVDVRKLR